MIKHVTTINMARRVILMNYKGIKNKKWNCCGCGQEINFRSYSDKSKYCSNACQGATKTRQVVEQQKLRFQQGKCTMRKYVYLFLVERDGNKCAECGIISWNNKPIRLWVDHIDGNATNNNPLNFRLVCPNCDCQTNTFGSKNRGNGRKSHGLPTYG